MTAKNEPVDILNALRQELDELREEVRTPKRKEGPSNREARSLGSKPGHRYCTDKTCGFFLVRVPVDLLGSETVTFYKDPQGNVTDRVEASTISWDFADPADAVCEGCNKTVGCLQPDAHTAATIDDLLALQRRRILDSDDDATTVRKDIDVMRERQAKALARVPS